MGESDHFDKVERLNSRNLLKRVQDGKPLTKEQLDFLRGQIKTDKEDEKPDNILEQKIYLDDFRKISTLDPRRIQQLKKEGHIVDRGRGKYFISHVRDYICYLQRLVQKRKLDQAPKPGDLDPAQEKARADKERADKLAMENARERGELVRASEVDAMIAEVDGIIRTNFLALPSRLASELAGMDDPRAVQVRLDEEIRSVAAVG